MFTCNKVNTTNTFKCLVFDSNLFESQLSPANSYQELTLLDDNQKPWLVAILVCFHFSKVKVKLRPFRVVWLSD